MLSKYPQLLSTIKQRIQQAQYDALKAVNKELLNLYRDIGAMMVEKEKSHQWGENFIGNLAKDIQRASPGIKGFSERNIRYMKEFYLAYNGNQKLQPLVAEISRTKNLLIMMQCKDDFQREFYLKMTQKFGWTKNVLIHQIENQSYEKYLTNQTNFDITMAEKYKDQAKLAIKDEYTFDFLELGAEHAEKELEKAIIGHIKEFLTEFGGFFSFVGSQYTKRYKQTNLSSKIGDIQKPSSRLRRIITKGRTDRKLACKLIGIFFTRGNFYKFYFKHNGKISIIPTGRWTKENKFLAGGEKVFGASEA